jgi:aquaporin Z
MTHSRDNDSTTRTLNMRAALQTHWPEYLIEGWALGMFMISAGAASTLLEHPGYWLHQQIGDPLLRRALTGLAMGLTAWALIRSPWGQRSGAHMNPSVTLAFMSLGKVRGWDACFYIVAQFVGGTLGVLLVFGVFGTAFSAAPVLYIATLPGNAGTTVAFIAECGISAGMIVAVLTVANSLRFSRHTGVIAGLLVALYITVEAPLSGMSMNPARSFASAAPAGLWQSLWLYFTAPVIGMVGGAQLFRSRRAPCAKLLHPAHIRCIHCGHRPDLAADTRHAAH